MNPVMIRRLTNIGLRKGLAGSRPWLVVGISLIGYRVIKRIALSGDPVLYRTPIRSGDVFEIVTRAHRK